MPAEHSQTKLSLNALDAQNSGDGLFARYCRGRLKSLHERYLVTIAGSCALLLLVGPFIGAVTAVLALSADLLDCALMRWLLRRHPDGAVSPAWRHAATLTGAVQAGAIAVSVSIAWLAAGTGDARFFAIAYLFGSALTAGLTLVHNPAATRARMVVYFGTAAALIGHDALAGSAGATRFGFDVVAIGIFGYMVWVYIRVTASGLRHRISYQRALLAEKVQVEEAVRVARASEERARLLALVAEHANDGVVITDRNGRIEYVNDAFTRMSGLPVEKLVDQDSWNLLTGPDTSPEVMERIGAAMVNGQPLRTEILSYDVSGRPVWVELSLTPVFDESGELVRFTNVGRDISEAKRREEELSRAKLAAEDGSRAKSNFLATMTHEIRTPMNGIIGMADLLSQTRLDHDQKTYVDTMVQSGEALLTIIGDVLEATKLETGRVELAIEPFGLPRCVDGVARLLRPAAEKKGLALTVAIDEGCPARVRGDGGRVRQILMNLVGNAVKFTDRGFVSVRVGFDAETGRVTISVADSGIGISEDRIDHIFQSFAQEDGHITRRFGGTGLGLTISRMLAQAMGGDIAVASRRGEGSTFTVSLDLPRVEAGAESRARTATTAGAASLKGHRILVAEDNRTNRLLISKFLAGSGAEIQFAEDGVEAIAAYCRFRPDLVLMDVSMPNIGRPCRDTRDRSVAGPWRATVPDHRPDGECLRRGPRALLRRGNGGVSGQAGPQGGPAFSSRVDAG